MTLFAGIGLLALSSCSSRNGEGQSTAKGADPVTVTVATPSSGEEDNINVSGQIEAAQTASISTRIMGFITKINVNIGDHVRKGQSLVAISNDDILAKRSQADAMIAQAETAFRNAQKDYDRFNNLYKEQSASAKELDNVTLQYSAAKSALETAKQMRNEVNTQLQYSNLVAPFDGTVIQKSADAGSMASPGMPILTIERLGSYQVNASVPENVIEKIQSGQPAIINIKAADRTINGKITEVNRSSQFTGGQYIIKVNIPDDEKKGLYGGMYADVSIPVKQSGKTMSADNEVMVPLSSIDNKGDLTGLYTIANDGTASLRWIRLGKVYGGKVEVLSGLAKNEQFILSADGKLYNGVPVKIK
jgi:RND family efflux transporter MFP subunit